MTPIQQLTVEAGLKAEQDLLASVCAGELQAAVLFWQPTDRALVMPRRLSRLPGFAQASVELAASGWPILLRETGGEPVPQSASTVNIALVYAPLPSEGDHGRIEMAYRRLCEPICDLLTELGGTASLGKLRALSAMAASTSISMPENWSAPPSAGARAKAGNDLSAWYTVHCWWITSVSRWWLRSIASMCCAIWSNAALPTAISRCTRPLQPRTSLSA